MPKVPVIDIRPHDLETVRGILRRHVPGYEVWAFGSRVRWSAREYSDLDLAIRSDEEIPWDVISAIKNELSESNLPMMVDVLDMAGVSEKFRGIIEEEYAVVQRAGQSGWRNTKLGEICRINPDNRDSDWHHEMIRYIDISSVGSGIFNESPKKIPVGEAPSRAKRLVAKGDTIVSTVRPNRRSFMFLNSPPSDTVASTGFAVLRARKEVADPRFLYYLVTHQEFTDYLVSRTEGSAYPAVNPSVFGDADVCIPPLSEQRKIAHILGTLDDKIELNRQMNKTLEAMARTIFKSWFVDFAPVHAKAKGRDTGLPPEVADLFPDGFEDSELGEIPRGWETGVLKDLSRKPQYGYTASANKAPVGPKFLRITDINKNAWIDWASVPHCQIGDEDFKRYRVHKGDILIARMADPGHGVMIEEDVDAVFASYLIRFKPAEEQYSRFLQYWLRSSEYWEQARGKEVGTTRASLNANILGGFSIIIPPVMVAQAFQHFVNSIRARLTLSVSNAESLISTRDALLPKLLSGNL